MRIDGRDDRGLSRCLYSLCVGVVCFAACGDREIDPSISSVVASSSVTTLFPTQVVDRVPGEDSLPLLARAASVTVQDETIAIADRMNHRVIVYRADRRSPVVIGREGEGPGEFDSPTLVRLGPDGNVWVLDRSQGRISHFESDGKFIGEVHTPARSFAIAGPGEVLLPLGENGVVAVRSAGDSARPVLNTISASGEFADAEMARFAEVVRVGNQFVFWDNVDGEMWTMKPSGSRAYLQSVEVPGWLLENALAKQAERAEALNLPSGAMVGVELAQAVHPYGERAVWISLGWQELIGIVLPLGDGAPPVLVVPSGSGEHAGMTDSILLNDSTLLALYRTEAREYRLSMD